MDVTNVPCEIWIQTFGHLHKADLKALRLSGSHYLRSLASSLLFTTAYVAARKAVLNTFMALTTHPEYCNYVKELVFDSSYISSKVVRRNKNQKCGSSLATLFEEQQDIYGRHLQNALEKACRSLSNLTSVHYADISHVAILPGDCDCSTWERDDYQEEPLIRRIQSASSKPYTVSCHVEPADCFACTHHENKDKVHMKYGGFVDLMQALSGSAATEVSNLSMGKRNHAAGIGGMSYWFFSSINSEITHPYLYPLFSSLRKLDLAISSDWPTKFQQERCTTSGEQSGNTVTTSAHNYLDSVDLARLLGSAQNLQEVKLAGECLNYSLQFANTFSVHTWNKLRAVDLAYFKGSKDELEDFVKRHFTSLRHLVVDHFTLTSGSWENLGAVVRAVAPELELIFGIVYVGNRYYPIEYFYPLASKDFDESGLKIKERRRNWNGEGEDGEGDDNMDKPEKDSESDSESASESDCLSYSSDDSTPSTASNPRRKPDLDILPTLSPSMREKVECIRDTLPGCPVQNCRDALIKADGDHEIARKALFERFRYTELECMVGRAQSSSKVMLIQDFVLTKQSAGTRKSRSSREFDRRHAFRCL